MAGAVRARALFALAAGVLAIFLATSSEAQTNRSLSQVERDRRAENARAQRLRAQAAAASADANTFNARLTQAERRREEAASAALAAEERLSEVAERIETEAARDARARQAFENMVIAAAFSARRLELAAVRKNVFARAAAPELIAESRRSRRAQDEATTLSAAIFQERAILAETQTTIGGEQAELVRLLSQSRSAQARLAREAAAADRRVRLLAAEATSLRELARRVQRASAQARRPGPNVIPAAWAAPVQGGSIVRGFGEQAGGAPASQGALVRTRAGAGITAPAAGRVTFAGPFRSYGQVLILDLDGGYALVLTGLGATGVRVGEAVAVGQTIGQMPASATTAPELYVEVRRNGQPIDPGRWLGTRGFAAEASARTG